MNKYELKKVFKTEILNKLIKNIGGKGETGRENGGRIKGKRERERPNGERGRIRKDNYSSLGL